MAMRYTIPIVIYVVIQGEHMASDVQMTFRIDSELRREFVDLANQSDMSAAQVLRQFMRRYVEEFKVKDSQSAFSTDLISAAERRRREDAFKFASGSVGLEGFILSDQIKATSQKFIDGEIDLNQFIKS
jgi:hypothetical protein